MKKLFKDQPVFWQDPQGVSSGEYQVLDAFSYDNIAQKDNPIIHIGKGTVERKVLLSELNKIQKEIRALAYKKDGNNIKTIKVQAEQINPHVYTANPEDYWGTTYYDLYLDVNGVIYLKGKFSLTQLVDDNFITYLEYSAQNYLHAILTDVLLFPRKMEIEIVRQLGLTDKIEMLEDRRQTILNRREQVKQQANLEKELKETKSEEQRYQNNVNSFKEGKDITGQEFEEILKKNNITVHPRTLQNIRKYLNAVNSQGTIRVEDNKRNYSGVFDAIQMLRTKLKC